MRRALLIAVILACAAQCAAEDSTVVTEGFRTKPGWGARKIVSTAAVGGLLATSLVWSYDTWWRDAGRPFHFLTQDWLDGPHLGIDKVGHFYTSYFYFHAFRNIMLWGGHRPSSATLWAAGAATFFAVAIEVGDGVTPEYGFDYQDMLFNLGGIGYGLLQTAVPFLRNFTFKWSYVPRDGYRLPVRFTDYYGAHTYWLSANVNNLLPEPARPYWPDFLRIAVGMGVNDAITRREFVIGLDISIESLFSPTSEDWILLMRTLDMFHIPAPAIKLTEDERPRYYMIHTN